MILSEINQYIILYIQYNNRWSKYENFVYLFKLANTLQYIYLFIPIQYTIKQ